MAPSLKAPDGKFRVLGVDLFDHREYLVGDFDTAEHAFGAADSHNAKRLGPMDDVYYVYNDKGRYLRGSEAVDTRRVSA